MNITMVVQYTAGIAQIHWVMADSEMLHQCLVSAFSSALYMLAFLQLLVMKCMPVASTLVMG